MPNIQPNAVTDGIAYAVNTPLTSTEADVFNGVADDPVAVRYGEAVMAVVRITAQGEVANSSYVILQTDLGDGQWIDVAWCLWTGTSGQAVFVLCGGVAGNNAFQQSRLAGTAPSGNGSNQMALGGRIRFVGKATTTPSNSSSSSASSGLPLQSGVAVSIRYKLLGLR